MLRLKCLAQGSTGNCWVLSDGDNKLIIDAGIPSMRIKRGINYDLTHVDGVLITHVHTDHSLAADDLIHMGLKVFKPYETEQRVKKLGNFVVQAFDLPHNGTPNFGFFIKCGEHKMLYLTDMEMCAYNFKGLAVNTIVVEANYQDKFLNMDAENLRHKVIGHCEFETTKAFVQANTTDALKTVILTHLGQGTADGKEMVAELKKCLKTDVSVSYAIPDTEITLRDNSCPF